MQAQAKDIPVGQFFKRDGILYRRVTLRGDKIVRAQDSGLPCIAARQVEGDNIVLLMQDNSVQAMIATDYPQLIQPKDMEVGDVVRSTNLDTSFGDNIVVAVVDNEIRLERPYMRVDDGVPLLGMERYSTRRDHDTWWMLVGHHS